MKHLDAAFPAGLTSHGREYLIGRNFLTGTDDTGQETDLIFELVRRIGYPGHPSRYTSVFASRTLNEAKRFQTDYCHGAGAIWEVESQHEPFRGDHELLTLAGTPVDVWLRAERYWRSESTETPAWELLLTAPVVVLDKA
jgi:hypothetical protein